jgi:hypothetical protein
VGEIGADGDREGGLGRAGFASDIGIAGGVEGNAAPIVVAGAADIAEVQKAGTGGRDLGDEGVVAAVVGEVGADKNRKGGLVGKGGADEMGATGGVDGEAEGKIVVGAADVAAVDQGRPGWIEFGDERVLRAIVGEVGPDENRKGGLRGVGVAADVGVAGRVDGDAASQVVAVAPNVADIEQGRAGGIDFGNKPVAARVMRQVGTTGHRKAGLRGLGVADDVGVARGIDGDRLD